MDESAALFLGVVDELLDARGLLIAQSGIFAREMRGERLIHRTAEESIEHLAQRMKPGAGFGLRGRVNDFPALFALAFHMPLLF